MLSSANLNVSVNGLKTKYSSITLNVYIIVIFFYIFSQILERTDFVKKKKKKNSQSVVRLFLGKNNLVELLRLLSTRFIKTQRKENPNYKYP